jgi:D-3-phosphoglycerate dehydrogenase
MEKNCPNKQKFHIILDFDSTFVQIEALDRLAETTLKKNPKKDQILEKIKKITELGMNGKISFTRSLSQRLSLFHPHKKHIKELLEILKKNITPSINRNKEFFKKYCKNIYIISGGFIEFIWPIVKPFGLEKKRILANCFIFNQDGVVCRIDKNNIMAQKKGKVQQIKALNLQGKVYIVGDGYTDYQIKKEGLADKFFIFCENIKRGSVVKKSDYILPNLDEFLYLFDLPRVYSYPKNRIKVLLLENISQTVIDLFNKEGYQIVVLPQLLKEGELVDKISNFSILGIRSKTKISSRVLLKAKNLLAIGVFSSSFDQIDLKTSSQRGVVVFNASCQKDPDQLVARKLINYINTGDIALSLNLPNLQLPRLKNAYRLTHIYKNVSGVRDKINEILEKNNIIVKKQCFRLNKNIGYLITDIKKQDNERVINELKKIPETIRLRVLY